MITIDQLKNKESVMNLLPMPVARSQDYLAFNYDSGTKPVISNANGGMLIDATSISSVQNAGAISSSTATLQPGTYVFAAYICTTGTFTSQDAVAALYDAVNNRSIASITPADFNSNTIRKTFTIETSVEFKILYKTPPSAMTVAYGCVVYSVRDWNKLQKLGVNWFNPIDKTYAKTSQLTSMWTGAVNASTSTLSQDGNLVATNQATNHTSPRLGNSSITCTSLQDGFTLSCGTAYTGNVDNDVLCANLVTGSPYHFHAEFVSANVSSLPDLAVWSLYFQLPTSVLAGGVQTFDRDFNCGNNTWDWRRFSFKTGKSVGDTVTWRNVGVYSAADWAAMQAIGINWFSGDTYSNLYSLSNIASDADFLGADNASPSVMTINKQKVHNFIPCPRTMHLGNSGNASNFRKAGTGTCENMPMLDCPVPVTSGIHANGSNSGAVIDDKTVPVGNYVFAVYAKAAAGVGIKLQIDWNGSSAGGTKYFIGDGDWHQYFTTGNITDASLSYACIYNSSDNGGAVGDVYFAAPIFCTVSDWDTLQYVNSQYFDGSTNLLSNN
jgi:hypothetical protein